MHHEHALLDGPSQGNAAAGLGRGQECGRISESLVQAGTHHANELGDALQTLHPQTTNDLPDEDLGGIRGNRSPSVDVVQSVAPMGESQGLVEALLADLRTRGYRCGKTELSRLLNTVAESNVISDRQLRRHSTRSGHRILDGHFVSIPRYIAWLVDEVHAPPPQPLLSSRKGTVTTHGILHVIEHQARRCALSGRQLVPEEASLDHVLPLSRGGKHTLDNIQILHRDVNRAKSTLTNPEFIALCREVVAWVDRSPHT